MKKMLLSNLVFWICSLLAFGQSPYSAWRLLDASCGLNDNQIRGITQAENGLMVIKTAEHINVYNGVTVQHFTSDSTQCYAWEYDRESHEYHDHRGRIWVKGLDHLMLLDIHTGQYVRHIKEELQQMGVDRHIKDFYIDEEKSIWFVTDHNDIMTYDSATGTRTILYGNSDATRRYGTLMEMTRYKNFCWLFFDSGILVCIDYVSGEIATEETYFMNKASARMSLQADETGNLWIAMGKQTHHYDRLKRTWKSIYTISGTDNFFTCMDIDQNGSVWVGTSKSGIATITGPDHAIIQTQEFNIPGYGPLQNDIYDIYCDDEGGIWVGTLFMGLCYYHPMMNRFQYASTSPSNYMITSENVRCFLPCSDGTVLVGSNKGLFSFDPTTRNMSLLHKTEENDIIISLFRDSRNRIWAGTFLNSFYLLEGNSLKRSRLNSIQSTNVGRAMYEDDKGRLWVSTNSGIALYNDQTQSIEYLLSEKHPEISHHKLIHALYPDRSGHGFTTIGRSGIFHYDTQSRTTSIPKWATDMDIQDENSFCILQDQRDLLWVGTPKGLYVYDLGTKKGVALLNTADGLSNNNVTSISMSPEGDIWTGTDYGVNRIIVKKENGYKFHIQSYDKDDGIQTGKFYENSICCTDDGTMFFGGVNGINYTNTKKIETISNSRYHPIFTSLHLFGQQVVSGKSYQKRLVLPGNICYTKDLTFNYNQNNITLSFSTLNYSGNGNIHYRYKLHGNDKDWTEGRANGLGQITYTGLPPGNYTLEIDCNTANGGWDRKSSSINIRILPPVWDTWWAKCIYFLVFSCMLYCGFHFFLRRRRILSLRKEKDRQHRQQEELNQMKFRFFTNVSHEFRTPLTLIITPLEAILHRAEDNTLRQQLKPIYTNAQRLLQLVNQLLDFRRLEMGGEHLKPQHGELVRFINDICRNFKDTSDEKQITLSFHSDLEHLYIAFDFDKVYKIIGNLLSNAFKYTPSGGQVDVKILPCENNQYVNIIISDTGQGIAQEELDLIWERFYQADAQEKSPSLKGSGIGLHIVKEYTEMHKGHIEVKSDIKKGTVFTVQLPTTLHPIHEETEEPLPVPEEIATSKDIQKPCLLIVDDNDEFLHFMTEQLSQEGYKTLEASDGIEAEEMAAKHNPDLIITDLMMPRCDGIELTQTIKKNITTSHIPIILLTAKAGDEAKIDAFRAGADDYIAKPFNYELLLIRVQQLIEKQRERMQHFRKNIDITPSEIAITSLDEDLINRAINAIEKHISDGEFGIEQLAFEVGMSKTHLNRKLQGIVGITPLQFIRNVRLKRAAQLLRNSQYNISEIAYMTGFNTIKYFNKHFKDEFNMTPTQYREEHGTK